MTATGTESKVPFCTKALVAKAAVSKGLAMVDSAVRGSVTPWLQVSQQFGESGTTPMGEILSAGH